MISTHRIVQTRNDSLYLKYAIAITNYVELYSGPNSTTLIKSTTKNNFIRSRFNNENLQTQWIIPSWYTAQWNESSTNTWHNGLWICTTVGS